MKSSSSRFAAVVVFAVLGFVGWGRADTIAVSDPNVVKGLSPYNWVHTPTFLCSSTCGATIHVAFAGTKNVALNVSNDHINMLATNDPPQFPILAWTVNHGPVQKHQLAYKENSFVLAVGVDNPEIDLYINGMSPMQDRFSGDVPPNSVKITGFTVDSGGKTASVAQPDKIWLNIGDSIMSGDRGASAANVGPPANNKWAAAGDSRVSYGYLLAQHFGYRESRVAYGGYDWGGGLANMPSLDYLVDHVVGSVSRSWDPHPPDVVLINLGENGPPTNDQVVKALTKLRAQIGPAAKVIVMIPLGGSARVQVTGAFAAYQATAHDARAYLVDLGTIHFETADGQHPTVAGYQTVYQLALPKLEAIVNGS